MSAKDTRLQALLNEYNTVVKPLITDVEAIYQQFPLGIYNEVRALMDHIARCYLPDCTDDDALQQLEKADRHIYRIILDCHKAIHVYHHDEYKRFERKTRKIDLKQINDGNFYIKLRDLKLEATHLVREAKKTEGKNEASHAEKIDAFEAATVKYKELQEHIDIHHHSVNWMKVKYQTSTWGKRVLKLIAWLISAVATIVLTDALTQNNNGILRQLSAWLHQWLISLF